MKYTRLLSISFPSMIAVSLAMPTFAWQAAAPSKRPRLGLLRQNEDWSFLADESQRSDVFDPIKYVPLSDDGNIWVSFGGSLRARVESWKGFNFGAPPMLSHDDTFMVSRAFVHADLHLGDSLRVFGELKSAQSTERDLPGGRRPLDMDTGEIQQLFVDAKLELGESSALTLRGGRQMLSFGAQRLVSPLPWGNALRTWEGATAVLQQDAWTVTGIATAFVPVDKTEYNVRDDDQLLYGFYARHDGPGNGKQGTELYWLGSTRQDVVFNGTSGDSRRHTVGVRRHGPIGQGFDGDAEVSYQFGEVGEADVSAWSVASQLGYRPDGGARRYWLGLDWASGDNQAGGDVQTFDALYPLGHAYFGSIDAIGRQNIYDSSLGASWAATPKVDLALAGHSFWLASKDDALYNAGGGPSRAPGSFDSSWVGWELDLTATWRPVAHVAAQIGLSRLFAGRALEQSGPDEDIDFAYLSLSYTF